MFSLRACAPPASVPHSTYNDFSTAATTVATVSTNSCQHNHYSTLPAHLPLGVTALLALLYVAGYLAVLSGAVPILLWSQTFRGVSLVAIPVVWILPAVHLGRRWEHDKAAAAKLVAAARDLHHSER